LGSGLSASSSMKAMALPTEAIRAVSQLSVSAFRGPERGWMQTLGDDKVLSDWRARRRLGLAV